MACRTILVLLVIGTPVIAAPPLATSETWSRDHAAHLLRRAGFGGTPEQVDFLAGLGRRKAVAHLLDDDSIPNELLSVHLDAPPPPIRQAHPDADREQIKKIRNQRRRADRVLLQQVIHAWLANMVSSPRPLQEKMVLFWHGHFTSGYREVRSARAMHLQHRLFRRHATGNFRDLLIDITEDPAMILYLNTQQSNRRKPNENYARELMELFSMGVGNYTEKDIKQAARAFTGIRVDPRTGKVAYRGRLHDYGKKTFLGKTGEFDPVDIIDLILEQPVTAEFMARKLWTFFAYEDPDDDLVRALAARVRDAKYNVKTLLRAMFLSDAFYGDRARFTHVKSPVELLVGTLRTLDATPVDIQTMTGQLRAMGQQLMQPPNVKGWDGGMAWINTSTLFNRYNALAHVVFGNDNAQFRRRSRRQREQLERTLGAEAPKSMSMNADDLFRPQPAYDPMPVVKKRRLATAEDIVDHYLRRLLQRPVDPQSRRKLIDALEERLDTRNINSAKNAPAIRSLIHLILSMPEYQMS